MVHAGVVQRTSWSVGDDSFWGSGVFEALRGTARLLGETHVWEGQTKGTAVLAVREYVGVILYIYRAIALFYCCHVPLLLVH